MVNSDSLFINTVESFGCCGLGRNVTCFSCKMSILSLTFLLQIVKIVVLIRLLTYGSSRILRYLMWKHERRLAKMAMDIPQQGLQPKKKSFLRRYVSILIGSGMLGFFIVKRVHPDYRQPGKEASNWEVTFYTLLPLRIMSRLWGAITNIDLPVFIRPKIYSLYAKSFGVNLDECEVQDLTCYRSLSEFFIRPLRKECRPINSDCKCVVSPADGRVLTFGKITSCQVDQVKGVTYSLQQFLGKQSWRKMNNRNSSYPGHRTKSSTSNFKERNWFTDEEPSDEEPPKLSVTGFPGCSFELAEAVSNLPSGEYLERLKEKKNTELYQCVVYLAPGDYHRFHSPVSWNVKFRRHFQGKLLSVNPAVASWINNLFSLNERAVYVGSWDHGFFSLTAVGATNVGYIRVVFDPSLQTNRWIVTPREKDLFFAKDLMSAETESKVSFKRPVEIEKGQLFGEFRLGSTIVLIFEAPKNFHFNIERGQKIKYGEKIGAFTK